MNNTTINNTLNSNIDIANIRTQHREIFTKKTGFGNLNPLIKKKKKKKIVMTIHSSLVFLLTGSIPSLKSILL